MTVTADSGQAKIYGTPDPTLTYTVTSGSLQPGDSFTGALARTAGENVGVKAINQGTLTAGPNYTITFVPANFTIVARSITVTAERHQDLRRNDQLECDPDRHHWDACGHRHRGVHADLRQQERRHREDLDACRNRE